MIKAATRAALLKWHRRIGLAFGILLLIQGLTGTMLVFRHEIERTLFRELTVTPGPRLTVDQIIDAVRKARPGATIQRIIFSPDETEAASVRMLDTDGGMAIAAIDPATGRVVRQGRLIAWPGSVLFYIHDQLFAGDAGELIVGVDGCALLFMLSVGSLLWWPGRQRLRTGFRVIRGAGIDRLMRSLHRTLGAGLALLLILSATTGMLMIFKNGVADMLGAVVDVVPKPAPVLAVRLDAAMIPLETLVARAQAHHGAAALREVRLSGAAGQVVAVYLEDARSRQADAVQQVYFNRYTGNEIARYAPSALPMANGLIDGLHAIHTGRALGLGGRMLILCGGLGLIFSAVSGFWMWFYARRQKHAARARRAAAKPVPDDIPAASRP